MKIPYSARRGKKGIFVYRRRVPTELQDIVGAQIWKESLGTSNEAEALARAVDLVTEHNATIASHTQLPVVDKLRARIKATQSMPERKLRHIANGSTDVATMRQRLINNLSKELLKEAAKQVGGLPDEDATLVKGAGGLPSLFNEVQLGEISNQLYRELFPIGGDVRNDPREHLTDDERERREEEVEREHAAIKVSEKRLQRKRRVLEKLRVLDPDDAEDPANPRINTVIEKWLAHQKQGAMAKQRHRVAWRRFVEKFGNVPVKDITQAQVLEFRDFVETIPDARHLPTKKRNASVAELKKIGKNAPLVSSTTIERHLISVKAMLTWCRTNVADFGAVNVASGITAARDTRKQREIVRSFTRDELALITSKIGERYDWTRGRYKSRKHDMYWLVWAGLYSGCRLEELCQLARENLRQVGGIWVFDINDRDGRKLKNEFSERLVPIHPKLIKMGFVDWATKGEGKRVFTSFVLRKTISGASYGGAASSSFARFLDAIDLSDPTVKFHSFRHTFIEAIRNSGAPYSVELALSGHADKVNPVHGGYGSRAEVRLLAEWIRKIDPMKT